MRSLIWYLLATLAVIITASDASSVFKVDQDPAADTLSGGNNNGKRYLTGAGGSSQHINAEKERSAVSAGVSTLFSKLKRSIGKLKLHYQDLRKNRFLTKMEDMFEAGATPDKLAELYGSAKKIKLQSEFRQFYKWRSSWAGQAQKYPKPGNLKAAPKLERSG